MKWIRSSLPGATSVVGRGSIWSPPKFSWRQYVLIVSGLLLLAGGVLLLADTAGYRVDGNVIRDASGAIFTPHGVDRPSLEWSCSGEGAAGGTGINPTDYTTMKSKWGANSVRIGVSQDLWLGGSLESSQQGCSSTQYQATVKSNITAARAAGLVVILDLHWSDAGNLGNTSGQQCMPDSNSVTFWQQAAAAYSGDSGVWYELYNEPHPNNWSIWQNGGSVCGFQAVGMQTLVNTVRATGASNIILAGGDGYASHLDGVPMLTGSNIAYAIHPYANPSNPDGYSTGDWDNRFGYLTPKVPVVATEFGNPQQTGSTACQQPSTYSQGILDYFRTHGVGYTAWAWFADVNGGGKGPCGFPVLITGATDAQGNVLGTCYANDGSCLTQQDLLGFASGKLQMVIPGQSSSGDTIPPTVSVSAPSSGATVSGTTTISANASDNVGVTSVQFKLDGSALGSPDTAGPYTHSWNTATVSNGSHTLTAVASDAAGNTATATSVTVNVSNTVSGGSTTYSKMIGINGTYSDSSYDYIKDAAGMGVQWMRIEQWNENTSYAPNTQWVATQLYSHNVHMLPLVNDYGTSWVQDGSCTGANYTGTCTGKAAWVQALVHAATTYGKGGTFWQGKTDLGSPVIEAGNEVYGAWYHWPDQGWLDPGDYAKMVKEASIAVNTATNGRVKVLASVTTDYQQSDGSWHHWAQDMKAAVPDIESYIGGVISHSYGDISAIGVCLNNPCSTDPNWSHQSLYTIHSQWSVPVYVTETGQKAAAATPGNGQVGYTEQAAAMDYYFNELKNNTWEAGLFWYNQKDYGAYNSSDDNGWALIDQNNVDKAAWKSYQNDATALESGGQPPPDTTPPSVPAGLSATAPSSAQVNLSWSASTDNVGVTGYRIYRNGSTTAYATTTAPTTNYQDVAVSANTKYSYTVTALDAAGNQSGQSSVASVTTPAAPDKTPPSVPTGLNASAVSETSVTLSWNPSTDTGGSGLAGYHVYRATGSGSAALIASPSGPTFVDNGVIPGTKYTYSVSAYDNAANGSAASSPITVTTPSNPPPPDTTPPTVPQTLTASAPNSAQVSLSWQASTDSGGSGLASYKIYRNGSTTALATVTAPTVTYTDSAVSANTQYSYSVIAVDGAGNQSGHSNTATVTTPSSPDKTPPSVPTGLHPTATTTATIALAWNASIDTGGSGLAGYHLYRNGNLIASPSGTTYTDSGLTAGTTYNYSVSAYDKAANGSAASVTVNVATQAAVTSVQNFKWNASTRTLSWSAYPGAYGYTIATVHNPSTTRNTAYTWPPVTGTSYTPPVLKGETVNYGIRPVLKNADGTYPAVPGSTWATEVPVTWSNDSTPPSIPTNFHSIYKDKTTTSITLAWNASTDTGGSGLAGYRLYRNGVLIASPTSTTYIDHGLKAGTTYSYTLKAYDKAGNASAVTTLSVHTRHPGWQIWYLGN